jgi:hypothetical protein
MIELMPVHRFTWLLFGGEHKTAHGTEPSLKCACFVEERLGHRYVPFEARLVELGSPVKDAFIPAEVLPVELTN